MKKKKKKKKVIRIGFENSKLFYLSLWCFYFIKYYVSLMKKYTSLFIYLYYNKKFIILYIK